MWRSYYSPFSVDIFVVVWRHGNSISYAPISIGGWDKPHTQKNKSFKTGMQSMNSNWFFFLQCNDCDEMEGSDKRNNNNSNNNRDEKPHISNVAECHLFADVFLFFRFFPCFTSFFLAIFSNRTVFAALYRMLLTLVNKFLLASLVMERFWANIISRALTYQIYCIGLYAGILSDA